MRSPSNTLTFGKVTAFQQLHQDAPERINYRHQLNLWLIHSTRVPEQTGRSGLSFIPLESYIRFVYSHHIKAASDLISPDVII